MEDYKTINQHGRIYQVWGSLIGVLSFGRHWTTKRHIYNTACSQSFSSIYIQFACFIKAVGMQQGTDPLKSNHRQTSPGVEQVGITRIDK